MSLYRVVCDDVDILDFSKKSLTLLSPSLQIELNSAGSFEFVMPPNHIYYDKIKVMRSNIDIYENDKLIWFGRPVEETVDFYGQKKVYCEGPLSFFNDTYQEPREYESIALKEFFGEIIQQHNNSYMGFDTESSVFASPKRLFTLGDIQPADKVNKEVYRKHNYISTYDLIQSQILNAEGGYLFFSRPSGNVIRVDWVEDMPYVCNQPIKFGSNLLSYRSMFDGSDFATAIIPLGKQLSSSEGQLTIADANNGSKVYFNEDLDTKYGRICKVVTFSGVEDANELLEEGKKYLENAIANSTMIECSAVDLHSKNPEYDSFLVGQTVHCTSEPHSIDRDLPISKMSIDLSSAAKVITLGTLKKKTLTKIYKEKEEEAAAAVDYGGYYGGTGTIVDGSGIEWDIIIPGSGDDSGGGGAIVAAPFPTRISIASMPYKTSYQVGQTLDFSGISVNIWYGETIWRNPPQYASGQVPRSELAFSRHTAPDKRNFSVGVSWVYKGKAFYTSISMTAVNSNNR